MKPNLNQKLAVIDLINQFKKLGKSPKAIIRLINNPKIAIKKLLSPINDVKLKEIAPEASLKELQNAWIQLSAINQFRAEEFTIEGFLEKAKVANFMNANKLLNMKIIFDLRGSDKASIHDYHKIYQPVIDSLTASKSKIKILEIGIGTNNLDVLSNMGVSGKPGASLLAFSEYSPTSDIYGLDIDKRILFQRERVKTFFADQLEPRTFQVALMNLGNFDLIIDDGLHTPLANINSISSLLWRLNSGGWMIIEDIGYNELNRSIWNCVYFMLPEQFQGYIVKSKSALVFLIHRTIV